MRGRHVTGAAAAVTGKNGDDLRAAADAKIARNATWATGLRPMLLELRGLQPPARAEAYTKVIAEIEKP